MRPEKPHDLIRKWALADRPERRPCLLCDERARTVTAMKLIDSTGRLFTRASLVLLALASVGACIPLGQARYWESRPVVAKSGTTLTSYQGAWCEVSSADAEKVKIGQNHRCVWQSPNAGKPPIRPTR